MFKKVFFSDLDGTLLNNNHRTTLFTRQIIKKLNKKEDYLLVVNTGRVQENAIKISKKLGCHKKNDGYVISNNGAQIYSFKENKIIYNKFISNNDLNKLNEILFNKKNIDVQYYSHNSIAVYRQNHESLYWAKLMNANYEIITNKDYFNNNNNIVRALLIFDSNISIENQMISEIKKLLPNISINKQTEYVYEITEKNVNKGTAMKFISNRLKLKKDDIVSFGDSYNDFSLIKTAGHGVVVKNAVPELKKIADEVIDGNYNNGPAVYILKKYIRKQYNNI